MSEQMQVTPETSEVPVPVATEENAETTAETEAEPLKFSELRRQYFSPEEMEKASEFIGQVLEIAPENGVIANFDLENDEIPEGWGLSVVPISKRVKDEESGEGKTVNLGVCIAKVPSPELVLSDDAGKDYVRRTLMDSFISQVASAARPDKDTGEVDQDAFVPADLSDFITIRSKGEGLKTFNLLAPDVVKLLKKKSKALKFLNVPLLRNALQNAAWAETTFKNVPQTHWEGLLKAMIEMARRKEADPSILQQWLARRDQAEMEVLEEDDFASAIASLE